MTQTSDLIKKMAYFFTGEEFYEKGEDARLELSPDDVRCMNDIIKQIGSKRLKEQEPCEDATKLAEALIDLRLKGEIKDITFVRKFINDVEIQVKVSVKDTRPCFCGAELEDVSEIYHRMKGNLDGKDDN